MNEKSLILAPIGDLLGKIFLAAAAPSEIRDSHNTLSSLILIIRMLL